MEDNLSFSSKERGERLSHCEKQKKQLIRGLQVAKREIDFLKSINNELSEKVKSHETEIQAAQKLASRWVAGNVWVSDEDMTLRDKINELHSDISGWAKEYSLRSINDMAKEREILLHQLTATVKLADGKLSPAMELSGMHTKSPYLLLTSALTAEIYRLMFDNIFFFFDDETDVECTLKGPESSAGDNAARIERTRSQVLSDTYDQLSKCQ
jgi:hypothetical protein